MLFSALLFVYAQNPEVPTREFGAEIFVLSSREPYKGTARVKNGNRIKNINKLEENQRFSTLLLFKSAKRKGRGAMRFIPLPIFYSFTPKIPKQERGEADLERKSPADER